LTYVDGQVTFALSPLIRGISLARKILLADDSVTAQNMGRKILADAGYEVIAVNNGSAALKKIAELKPDLVILDVYMPGYSGLEVCQRLKESQETSRIPVLLSVGKLEPFKPEEAQRVRADGYIVKPFEASELLSALSKLEDKVVPRAEPSKPGRFARAIAAAEESGRGSANPTAGDQNGWKSRIGFPHEKPEAEEKVAEESTIYNPMNRDLRTVVETAGETAAQQEEKRLQSETVASVDVAALAPAGLPQDVTPEEVAAIAAAAAQIQMAGASLKSEPRSSEAQIPEAQISETRVLAATPQAGPEATPASSAENNSHTLDIQSAPAPVIADATTETLPEKSEEQQDVPVTMAATAESVASSAGSSRWTAVPVALEGDEATVSLDQEMQKAYATFVAAQADSAAGSVPEVQPTTAEAAVEAPVEAIPEPEPARNAEAIQTAPVAQSEAVTSSYEPVIPSPVESAQVDASDQVPPAAGFTEPNQEPNQEPTPAEFLSPVSDAEIAGLAGLVGLSAESQLAPEAVGATPETTSATSTPFTRIVRAAENVAENESQPAAESRPDPETVKNTAAAWANWRQIRDTSKGSEAAQGDSKEFDAPESAPAETARAAAAGAEQNLQDASSPSSPSSENPGDVASIVDSVLADLRPKLMAEISRKMSEKK
jgi:two-component system chemotaxis response regulator CheY